MRIILSWGYLPPEVRQAVRPLVIRHLWLLPDWCRRLQVRYEQTMNHEGDEGPAAHFSALSEYRFGELVLHGGFLDENPRERELTVIHELLHCPTAPLASEHEQAIERLFEGSRAPKYEATLQENWRRVYEGCVQDLAYSIMLVTDPPAVEYEEIEDEHPTPQGG